MNQLGLHLKLTESIVVSFDHVDHTHICHKNMYDHTTFEEFMNSFVEEEIIIDEAYVCRNVLVFCT